MKSRVNITIDYEIHKKLEKIAEKEQRTMSNLINLLLRKSLEEIETKENNK